MLYLLTGLILLGAIAALAVYYDNHQHQHHHAGHDLPAPSGKQIPHNTPDKNSPQVCCGQHDICEQGLPRQTIEYYDDEELDQYRGIAPDRYDEKAVDAFSEVLYTLQANEVSDWLYNLQLRNVFLPDQLKDEALLIIEEQRYNP